MLVGVPYDSQAVFFARALHNRYITIPSSPGDGSDTEYKGILHTGTYTPTATGTRAGRVGGGGSAPPRMNSDLERLDDARELGARAHGNTHGAQVLGLQ